MDVAQVLDDLISEQEVLDSIVSGLDDSSWQLATPSPGWTVADQIGHLAYFDQAAALAITDPDRFMELANDFLVSAGSGGLKAADDWTLASYRAMAPTRLLESWRRGRHLLAEAGSTLSNDTRIAWYGPSMGARSFLTARLMEVWAHGQDVVDAVGIGRRPTDRLRHIAQLGFITRDWTYANRSLDPPDEPVRVRLRGPSGDEWSFGPDTATEWVEGSAEEFCLVVTQRRHLDDTRLRTSPLAREWLLIAQAYAGPATDGPEAGTRV